MAVEFMFYKNKTRGFTFACFSDKPYKLVFESTGLSSEDEAWALLQKLLTDITTDDYKIYNVAGKLQPKEETNES